MKLKTAIFGTLQGGVFSPYKAGQKVKTARGEVTIQVADIRTNTLKFKDVNGIEGWMKVRAII